MMKWPRFMPILLAVALVGGLAAGGWLTRGQWRPWLRHTASAEPVNETETVEAAAPSAKVIVSEQAQQNLELFAKPLAPQTFWKTIQVPGMVVDRPGQSDRGVVAPVTSVVAHVARFPGDAVETGETLFTLKLLSDSIHLIQTDLFKTSQDIALSQAERKRLAASADAVPQARVIEVENQITRLQVAVKAYRQELLNRGFRSELIDGIAAGEFAREISVVVPPPSIALSSPDSQNSVVPSFEMQELKVGLGQQVQAGQTLCLLANHQFLAIEGRAFRDETALLEQSVKQRWPVEVDFQENEAADWPTIEQTFQIRHLANTIDPINRTFAFLMPLTNQSRVVKSDDGETQTLWRFRPGQKVRLMIRVAQLEDVFVLPAEAVVYEGPETFVFTQNVNTFERKPVRVLHRDRQRVAIANDGSLLTGAFVAQIAAAQLNRMLKAGGSGDGMPKGFHVHADGSLHKNEDEGK